MAQVVTDLGLVGHFLERAASAGYWTEVIRYRRSRMKVCSSPISWQCIPDQFADVPWYTVVVALLQMEEEPAVLVGV
jgi:hypothetical protein